MLKPAMLFCLILLGVCWSISAENPPADDGGRCNAQGKRDNALDLTIFSTKNKRGNWTTSFIADKGIKSNGVVFALRRTVIGCEGTQVLRLEGLLQDFDGESHRHILQPDYRTEEAESTKQTNDSKVQKTDILKFDPELKGKKAVISEDGRTAYRTKPTQDSREYGNLITHRVLREEEMFQLKFEETIQEGLTGTVAIGLTTVIPTDIKTNCHISDSKNGTWVARSGYIIKDSSTIKSNYQLDMRNLTVGTIVGVMRKKNGDLHFYKNGNDMGLAATALPLYMYGIFDMRDYVTKVSIVD